MHYYLSKRRQNGYTPFLVAVINGHIALGVELLERGANINICDNVSIACNHNDIFTQFIYMKSSTEWLIMFTLGHKKTINKYNTNINQ